MPNTFNATLLFRLQRIVALDENGARSHTNRVCIGMSYFGQRLRHSHLHEPVPDSVSGGYAEPIDTRNTQEQWEICLKKARISGAPELELPITDGQMGFNYDEL